MGKPETPVVVVRLIDLEKDGVDYLVDQLESGPLSPVKRIMVFVLVWFLALSAAFIVFPGLLGLVAAEIGLLNAFIICSVAEGFILSFLNVVVQMYLDPRDTIDVARWLLLGWGVCVFALACQGWIITT